MALRNTFALGLPLLLCGCMTAAYIECSLREKPAAPAAKQRLFPFVVEFEQQGIKGVHRDTMVCDYQGVARGPDCSASHFWRKRLLSGAPEVTLIQSPALTVSYLTDPCEILTSATYRPEMRRDAYAMGADGIDRLLDEQELMRRHGIRITSYTVTELRPADARPMNLPAAKPPASQ
jgi:hypothetical protein